VAIAWAWQASKLASIPDVGDPFDLDAFAKAFPKDIPDERNAFWYYQRAVAALPRGPRTFADLTPVEDWTFADDELKQRLEEARPALDLWRQGTEQDQALYHRLEELNFGTILTVTQELRTFARLALLEGSRREAEGDFSGAWSWYRAVLRSSRHSGTNGCLVERLVGIAIAEQAVPRAERWAAEPRVDAALLRTARQDLQAIAARTPSPTDTLKLEYWILSRMLQDRHEALTVFEEMDRGSRTGPPPNTALERWLIDLQPKRLARRARITSGYEIERCERIIKLLYANRFPQLDRAPRRRAAIAVTDPLIYAADPTAPASAHRIPPEDLAAWFRETPLSHSPTMGDVFARWVERDDEDRRHVARLLVTLAEQSYRRDHDGQAPPSPQVLVPAYLDRWPEEALTEAPPRSPD
jgi:hypothetical protein